MLRRRHGGDIVVVLRKTFPGPLLWLLRRVSRRLVFDFDDAIFCNSDGTPSATRMRALRRDGVRLRPSAGRQRLPRRSGRVPSTRR
jgi:hypothetical protein